MNQLEQIREQCVQIASNEMSKSSSFDAIDACFVIANKLRVMLLPEVAQEPVTWLKFRAWQHLDTTGYCDGGTGFEVCNKDDIGDDQSSAFPVYALPPDAETLRKENLKLQSELETWKTAFKNLDQINKEQALKGGAA